MNVEHDELIKLAKQPEPQMKEPTEGCIVHYVAYNNRHLAAMVIGADRTKTDLVVFTNMKNVKGVKNFGIQFHQDVEFGAGPGTWHWIERA